jgi:hypothetical protein
MTSKIKKLLTQVDSQNEHVTKPDMEHDIKCSEFLCNKVKNSDVYAQNLYAALCNNEFQKLDVIPILKDQRWSCSWRYAGGIIADICEEGDYIDWYCSGIMTSDINENDDKSVSEGTITEEIINDLKLIGWKLIEE